MARANIRTYTAGPQKSMNLRMDSIPRQKTIACATHMIMKAIQPSVDRPANPCSDLSAHGASPGQILTASSTRALDARNVWMPYHATAMSPRMMAGTLAPSTPNTDRQITGYGTPAVCDGLATRLQKKY